jgi:hypothetical protein
MHTGTDEPEQEYEVPSSDGETTTLSRDHGEVFRLLETAYTFGIHQQAIIAAVALTEDYLQTTLRTVLRWFPQKLKQNVTGDKIDRSISLDMVLAAANKKQLLSRLINKQLQGIFYGAPSRYFEYIENVLTLELPQDLKSQFIEIKATRDAIVHNSGMVNETYLEKTGKFARAANREKLPVDASYFVSAIACQKKLVVTLYKKALEKYGNAKVPMSQ